MDQTGGRATGRSRRAKSQGAQTETAGHAAPQPPITAEPARGYGTPARGSRPAAGAPWVTGTPTYGPENADQPTAGVAAPSRPLQIGTRRYGPY